MFFFAGPENGAGDSEQVCNGHIYTIVPTSREAALDQEAIEEDEKKLLRHHGAVPCCEQGGTRTHKQQVRRRKSKEIY